MFQLVACAPTKEVDAGDFASATIDTPAASISVAAALPSCADPTPEMNAGCRAQAERILASTVRLEFHGPGGGIGHGTIFGSRYLITHNHYPVSGEALSRGGDGLVSAVSVLKANGDVILLKAPLSYFSIILIAPEALVLDFWEYGGVGFFDSVGVPSAEIASLHSLTIQPGDEVAQIDWDMTTTRVTWARVTVVHVDGSTPYVELDSFVQQGASGGGVFYNGTHIANNWSRNIDRQAETGEVLRRYSLAVLNIAPLIQNSTGIASTGN
ncbi:MAG: hypothetical protein KA586_03015 [Candidatus Promineofilum sp.]|nr:hypothetical protein [Promineifilum sp.]